MHEQGVQSEEMGGIDQHTEKSGISKCRGYKARGENPETRELLQIGAETQQLFDIQPPGIWKAL